MTQSVNNIKHNKSISIAIYSSLMIANQKFQVTRWIVAPKFIQNSFEGITTTPGQYIE